MLLRSKRFMGWVTKFQATPFFCPGVQGRRAACVMPRVGASARERQAWTPGQTNPGLSPFFVQVFKAGA